NVVNDNVGHLSDRAVQEFRIFRLRSPSLIHRTAAARDEHGEQQRLCQSDVHLDRFVLNVLKSNKLRKTIAPGWGILWAMQTSAETMAHFLCNSMVGHRFFRTYYCC